MRAILVHRLNPGGRFSECLAERVEKHLNDKADLLKGDSATAISDRSANNVRFTIFDWLRTCVTSRAHLSADTVFKVSGSCVTSQLSGQYATPFQLILTRLTPKMR